MFLACLYSPTSSQPYCDFMIGNLHTYYLISFSWSHIVFCVTIHVIKVITPIYICTRTCWFSPVELHIVCCGSRWTLWASTAVTSPVGLSGITGCAVIGSVEFGICRLWAYSVYWSGASSDFMLYYHAGLSACQDIPFIVHITGSCANNHSTVY